MKLTSKKNLSTLEYCEENEAKITFSPAVIIMIYILYCLIIAVLIRLLVIL